MAHQSSRPERAVVSRGDRVALRLTAAVAATVAALAAVGLVLSAVHLLGEDPLEVQGLELVNASTPEFTEPLEGVVAARYESVALTVTDAPASARWLLLGSVAMTSAAAIGVGVTLTWLCLRVMVLRPFGRSVTVALVTSAVAVMLGGAGSQVLAAAANAAIVDHLGPAATGGATAGQGAVEGLLSFGMELDLAPIGVGVALAVVALAFQLGARMQRDTEGLV